MKPLLKILLISCLAVLGSCKDVPDYWESAADSIIKFVNESADGVVFGYYIGSDKNFTIDADYVFNKHPECMYTLRGSSGNGDDSSGMIYNAIAYDGKESDRTFQFIFFNEKTLNEYTIPEIVEMNLYDDLRILSIDELKKIGRTIKYRGEMGANLRQFL